MRITNIPSGGYFIWIQLLPIVDIFDFLNFCHIKQSKDEISLELKDTVHNNKDELLDDITDYINNEYLQSTLHFMPGPKCDALYNTNSNSNEQQQQQQQQQQHNKNDTSSNGCCLNSYARLCFAEMDNDKIQKATYVLIHKFRAYNLLYTNDPRKIQQ
jgi:hypothetical protein